MAFPIDKPMDGRGSVAAAEERVRLAEAEFQRVQQADDFCMTSGSYDRAQSSLTAARRALTEAQVAHIQNMAADITARGEALMRAAGMALAHNPSMETH